ncbi:cytochrome P450 4C1 [Halictus rubicundus]|uniref:cytochrome P450 4C1 n=1 Tax=Halictus rubicundus TaxID=77578 RepID=UPI0040357A63
MIFTILAFILLGTILHFVIVHFSKHGRLINAIPGPQALPLLGNMYSFQVSSTDLWSLVRNLSDQYYPIFRLWGFAMPFLNIRHPKDIEVILGNPKSTQKSELYDLLMPWFNTGLLTSAGRKWQTRRKILTPAFHFNVLQQFVDVFIEESEQMNMTLKNEGGPIVRDLLPLISEHTLNVICETAMGTSLKDKGPNQEKYRKAVYDMGHSIVERLIRPWLYPDWVYFKIPAGWRQSKLLRILHGFTMGIIKERFSYHEKTNDKYLTGFTDDKSQKAEDVDLGIRKRRLAMLDLLIAAHRKNQIDIDGIREEVDTFMFEGHDTTAMSITFTIMLLAEHKEIQDRARAEVKEVLDANNGKMSVSTLQNLPYLERCIKESLRLYPSVPFISRRPEMDLKLNNYMIPAHSTIHVHIVDVHKDPQFWPNPEVYDPDRFLPENCQGRHPYCYIPFSAGPRNCIGQRFAMFELKAVVGSLLYNFELEPVDYLKDMLITSDLVIRPAHPVRTKFIPIENKC